MIESFRKQYEEFISLCEKPTGNTVVVEVVKDEKLLNWLSLFDKIEEDKYNIAGNIVVLK